MRNVVDWMRDVLFNYISDTVNIYDTSNARPEPEDASIPLASNLSFADKTQTQSKSAFSSQEILETDYDTVHDSTGLAYIDTPITT